MDVYNAHIQFLKERFDNLLNDLNILINLQKNNPKELNEKFSALIKSIQQSIDLINKISEREALIDNFKKELKGLKGKVDKCKGKIKNLEEENHELNDTLNVRKLQMKIKKLNVSPTENAYFRLTQLMKNYATLTELNLENNNLKTENDNQKAQIKLLNDSVSTLKEKLNQNDITIKGLNKTLENQTKEMNDSNKQHKNEMKGLIDEVRRIKSTWTPYDKKMEYVNNIDDLEKTIKNLKDELNRKNNVINSMKSQLERNNSEINIKQERENKEKNNEDKVKSLKNDISRKENIIKDLKINYENYKQQNKKLIEENEDLIEKNKVKKIEVSRKEDIIRDLRNKIFQLNQDIEKFNKITETQASSNAQNNINYQKLKLK
jgi:chromosome segregation ATPase